jgi:hypothetical protein
MRWSSAVKNGFPPPRDDGPDEQPVLVDEPSLHEGRGETLPMNLD